jgi:hypothetical protein
MNLSPPPNIATYRGDEFDAVCIRVLQFSCIYLKVGSAVMQWGILFGATLCCTVLLEESALLAVFLSGQAALSGGF